MHLLCGRRDSNPHTFRYQILSLERLPITPRPLHTGDIKIMQRYELFSCLKDEEITLPFFEFFWGKFYMYLIFNLLNLFFHNSFSKRGDFHFMLL